MTGFDRFCAVLAGLVGGILIILGTLGLFVGSRAHFSLPPVLGILPAFVGWGIVRSIILAWDPPATSTDDPTGFTPDRDSPGEFGNWGGNPDGTDS